MTLPVETAVAVVKTLTLVLGGLISYRSYRAFQRTGSAPLRALSIGFAIITVGTFLGGIVDVLSPFGIAAGVLLSSSLTLVGFAVIVYSLYMD
ncbi:MAG: hypothetical protein ABEJ74_02930 [Haloferacaceae archaeon]